MPNQADIWKPALIWGAVFGFLSGVPFVGALNCLCCSLIIGAGVVSSSMVIRSSTQAVTYGSAALTGLISGLVAAPVSAVTSGLFTLLQGAAMEEMLNQIRDQAGGQIPPEALKFIDILEGMAAPFLMVIMGCVLLVIYAPFGTIGGVIGRAIFEKRTPVPPMPPMPPAPPMGSSTGSFGPPQGS